MELLAMREIRAVTIQEALGFGALSSRDLTWWRFLSCAFIHDDWRHLGRNVFLLFVSARSAEQLFGSARLLVISLTASVAADLAAFFIVDREVVVYGFSNAAYGMVGALAVALLKHHACKRWFAGTVAPQTALACCAVVHGLAVSTLQLAEMPHDAAGHVTALLVGIVCGLFIPTKELPDPRTAGTELSGWGGKGSSGTRESPRGFDRIASGASPTAQ
jgi:membrane associated rhomboid family serine protease